MAKKSVEISKTMRTVYVNSKATSSPNSSKPVAVDSTIDVSVIEPSPPITVSDSSDKPLNLCNPFKYVLNKARQWSEPDTSKSSIKIETYEHKSDMGSDKSKECFRNKSDSKILKRLKAASLKIKDDLCETTQRHSFCEKIGKLLEDKKCPNYEFCNDVLRNGPCSDNKSDSRNQEAEQLKTKDGRCETPQGHSFCEKLSKLLDDKKCPNYEFCNDVLRNGPCSDDKSDSRNLESEQLKTKDGRCETPQGHSFCEKLSKLLDDKKCPNFEFCNDVLRNGSCSEKKSDSRNLEAEQLKTKDGRCETSQPQSFCEKIAKLLDDKKCPNYEFCNDVIRIGASSETFICENRDCPVKAEESMLSGSKIGKGRALKVEDSGHNLNPRVSLSDDFAKSFANMDLNQNKDQYCPLHAEGKNISTCSTQTILNELANTSSGFQESCCTGSLLDSVLPGICDGGARIDHITNKLRSALQIIQFQEETIKEQQGSLSVAENRIASLTERISDLRKDLDMKSKEVSLLRKKPERSYDRQEKVVVNSYTSVSSDVENQSDIVNTLQNNLHIIEELYRECFYETAKQEDLIDMLRTSYLDVRLQDKQKTEQIGRMQTVIDKQNWSLERCQDIALEVENLKSEICNFLSSSTSTNNDSGMWERSEESYASVPGVQEELQEIMEQLLTLREVLTLEYGPPLKVETKQLELLRLENKRLKKKIQESCGKKCSIHKELELLDKEHKEQIAKLRQQLETATKTIEKLEKGKPPPCPRCESLETQLHHVQDSLADKSDELEFMKSTCDSQKKTIVEISEKLNNAENLSLELHEANEKLKLEYKKLKEQARVQCDCELQLVLDAKEKAEKEFKKEIQIRDKQLKDAASAIKKLEDKVNEKDAQCESLNAQLRKMNMSLDENDDELTMLSKTNDAQQKNIAQLTKKLNASEALCKKLQNENNFIKQEEDKKDKKLRETCGSHCRLKAAFESKEKMENQYKKEIEHKDEQLAEAQKLLAKYEQECCQKHGWCEALKTQLAELQAALAEKEDELVLRKMTCDSQQKTIQELREELNNNTGNVCNEGGNIRKEVLNLTAQIDKWRSKLEESEAKVCKMDVMFRELESCYKAQQAGAGALRVQLEQARARGAQLCRNVHRMLAHVRRWARRMRRRYRLQEEQIKERSAYIVFLRNRLKTQRCSKCGQNKDTTDDDLSSSNSYTEPTYVSKNTYSFASEVPGYSSNSLRCRRNHRKRSCSEKCSSLRRSLVSGLDKTSLLFSEPDKCPEPTCIPRSSRSEGMTKRRSPELAWFDRTANQTPEVTKCKNDHCATAPCCSRIDANSSRPLTPTDQLFERVDQLTKAFYGGWRRWNSNAQNR